MERPACIAHWRDIQLPEGDRHYAGSTEIMARSSPFAPALGLTRLGIHHQVLPPGRRTSYPHAESDEEEFVYVISGTPDLWLDGDLHRLGPGDGVGFPPGTGQAHNFINNTGADVVLLVVGEAAKPHNRVFYPRNPEQRALRTDWWDDVPARPLGAHDGVPSSPDEIRVATPGRADPDFIQATKDT